MPDPNPILTNASSGVILEDLSETGLRAGVQPPYVEMTISELKSICRKSKGLSYGEIGQVGLALTVRTARLDLWIKNGPGDLFETTTDPLRFENAELSLAEAAEEDFNYQAKLRGEALTQLLPEDLDDSLSNLLDRQAVFEKRASTQRDVKLAQLDEAIAEVTDSTQTFADRFLGHPRLSGFDSNRSGELDVDACQRLDHLCNRLAIQFDVERYGATRALDALVLLRDHRPQADPYPLILN